MKYSRGQSWAALKKSWRGYKIAHANKDKAKMEKYATRVQTIQGELKLRKTKFRRPR